MSTWTLSFAYSSASCSALPLQHAFHTPAPGLYTDIPKQPLKESRTFHQDLSSTPSAENGGTLNSKSSTPRKLQISELRTRFQPNKLPRSKRNTEISKAHKTQLPLPSPGDADTSHTDLTTDPCSTARALSPEVGFARIAEVTSGPPSADLFTPLGRK